MQTPSQRGRLFAGLLEKDLKVTSVCIELLREDKTHIFLPLFHAPPPPMKTELIEIESLLCTFFGGRGRQ